MSNQNIFGDGLKLNPLEVKVRGLEKVCWLFRYDRGALQRVPVERTSGATESVIGMEKRCRTITPSDLQRPLHRPIPHCRRLI